MGRSIHPETDLGPVYLKVAKLERSIRYYLDIIGLRLIAQDLTTAQFTADDGTILLVLEELEDAVILPRRKTTGLYHFAILVPSREALGLAVRNFIERGVYFGQGDHLVSEALYLTDPDGNGIEVYADRPRDTWKYNAQGEVEMASNPVDIDGLLREAEGKAWTGLPAGTVIGHVHLHVNDLPEAKRFYCDILGFDLIAFYGGQALFVSAGGYHHHIGLNTWAGVGAPPPPEQAAGLKYFTVKVPDEEELNRLLVQLQEHGVPAQEIDGGWLAADPSSNKLFLTLAESGNT